ncbi:anti-sigma factor [Nocardia takedensis]|uniref:anti-sigma factor n=1 Tax=Nocardia takedensis TaxID=259390 RepID=UPI0005932065|nr:anti-sigma factor [Nocardia takedensis]
MGDSTHGDRSTTTVGVRVPARPDQLIMLRSLAETVSLIADFALDEVTDIRLALDEIATALVLDAAPDTEIDCRFTYDRTHMRVRADAVSASATVSARADLSRHIVQTLTESFDVSQAAFDPRTGGYPTVVEFDWCRPTAGSR